MRFSRSPDYEASLKKEGGIPDGPVLESLLAGETLDKKVETKEEEPMSECQVRLSSLSSISHLLSLCVFSSVLCFSVCLVLVFFLCQVLFYLCVCVSLSAFVFLGVFVLAVMQGPVALTTPSWHIVFVFVFVCVRLCVCVCNAASVFGLTLGILKLEEGLSTAPLCSLSPFIRCVALSNF